MFDPLGNTLLILVLLHAVDVFLRETHSPPWTTVHPGRGWLAGILVMVMFAGWIVIKAAPVIYHGFELAHRAIPIA